MSKELEYLRNIRYKASTFEVDMHEVALRTAEGIYLILQRQECDHRFDHTDAGNIKCATCGLVTI